MRLSTCFFIIALAISSYTYSNDAKKAWDSPEMGSRELSEDAWVKLEKYRLEREARIEEKRINSKAQITIAEAKRLDFLDACILGIPVGLFAAFFLKVFDSMSWSNKW